MGKTAILAAAFLCAALSSAAQEKSPELKISDKVLKMWADPVLQEKIALGIENNRKGDFYIEFLDAKNENVKAENVKVNMVSHEFLFGAQIFLLNGFPAENENRQYEENFLKLFNFATLPFYWAAYEQADGVYQFDGEQAGMEFTNMYRRPPQPKLIEFCKKHGLAMKGHPLSWYLNFYSLPAWMPRDEKIIEKHMCRYIDKIAERFDADIDIWDVSNEASDTQDREYYNYQNYFPRDHAYKAFKESARVFSSSDDFIVNFTTPVWMRVAKYRENAQDYLLASDLINRGAKVDVIGLQLHFFDKERRDLLLNGEDFTPDSSYDVLDTFARLNRPIHITEITFPCMGSDPDGERKQAFFVENFYRLWFSHQNVKAITYWHFVDGAAGRENRYNGGFLRRDFSKKEAFDILDNLKNKVWRTDLAFDEPASEYHFRCFYGKYKVTFTIGGKTTEKTVILGTNTKKRAYIRAD
ncbi:MAG: endo-1,4-beta-xylanase [Kiritimatiellae bacterium]|nr:endo-1,4-beta-xylanase [Kiritimatiellia bacterium]